MHRAISNAVRPDAFNPRPALRVQLSAVPIGCARIIEGWPVFRFGADLFAIDGAEGQHDVVSAASVLAGDGNPLPDTPN